MAVLPAHIVLSKCGISGGFWALLVIESRLFLCQTVCYVKRSPAEIHFQTASLQATSNINTGGIDYKNREWKTAHQHPFMACLHSQVYDHGIL